MDILGFQGRGVKPGFGEECGHEDKHTFKELLCRTGEKLDSRGVGVGAEKRSFKRREKSAVCMLLGLIGETGKP